jgi:DNA-directed RNA polymerase subunit RPC12/RpoP
MTEATEPRDEISPPVPDAEEHRFPCAQCGANLRYTPGQISMTCSYCGHEQDIPGATAEHRGTALAPLDLHTALARALPAAEIEETRVLSCPNCGAQVEFEPEVHSAECPFCATPVVTDTGTHRHIKPQGVLPFRLTEAEAKEAFARWLGGLWFAPNGLRKYARRDNRFAGIYVPYWAFDADSRSNYTGERGTHYYTGTGKRRRRHTRWRRVSGKVTRRFEDLLIMAARSLPRRYVRALEPWHLTDLEPYNPQFISGFRAEGYTVDLPDGYRLARERMDEIIRADVRRAIGGDVQRVHSVDTLLSDEKFKHLLLPLWVAAYRYRDQSYRFVVNAQTGKVRGERPWSWIKIALAVLAAALMIGTVVYLSEYQ